MRLPAHLLLVPCLAALAASPDRPVTGDATLSPYFFVKSEDPSIDRLPLRSTRAQVDIAGVIADVKVVQVYKNEGRKPLEAIYVFPGSTRSAVYGMRMTLGERVIQAQIREKQQARQDYEQAKQQGRSASLLEQQRPNVFQMNMANILPGDEIQVELSYTELLVPTAGVYSFVYPTVVGPRYAGTTSGTGEQWVANPHTRSGEAPLSTFDIQVRLSAGMPIQEMYCGSHETRIAYNGPTVALVTLGESEKRGGNRDYVLDYRLTGGQVQSGLLLSRGAEENFFLLMVQPPRRVELAQMPPREYVFIMDVSGSMNGYPIDMSKKVIRDLVSHLRPQDRFNILVFEAGSAVWSEKGSQPGTPENLKNALAFIGSHSGGGGTEMLSALKRALALPHTDGMSRTFVVATDGYVSADYHVLDYLRENLGDANMFAFGIGTSVNRFLIEGMARAGLGEPFIVIKPEEAEAKAARFREYISSPVLTNLKVAFRGFEAYDVEPLHVPDVLADRPIVCFGKWRGEAKGAIEVSGISGDGVHRQQFQVAECPPSRDEALRYLWARHRIQSLADYGRLGSNRDKEITALGLKYNLLTDFTSFIAIDSEIRNTQGQPASVTQPLPMPQGVSNLAVGGSNMAAATVSMAPGAATISGGYGASACVEVIACAAATCVDDAIDMLPQEPTPPVTSPVTKGSRQVETISADRPGLPLARITGQVEQKLKELEAAGLLKDLPERITLYLSIDGKGAVTAVAVGRPGSPSWSELERRILGWRLENWPLDGLTVLSIPLSVAP